MLSAIHVVVKKLSAMAKSIYFLLWLKVVDEWNLRFYSFSHNDTPPPPQPPPIGSICYQKDAKFMDYKDTQMV